MEKKRVGGSLQVINYVTSRNFRTGIIKQNKCKEDNYFKNIFLKRLHGS